MNKYYIPTIEEIYNIYHRETMHAMKGIYPKSIKNFENILNKKNIELLIRFQNVIKRNIIERKTKDLIKVYLILDFIHSKLNLRIKRTRMVSKL